MSFNAMTSQEPPDSTIVNDGFFPVLSMAEFLTLYRLPGEYAPELVENHLLLAVVWANRQLEVFKAEYMAAGKVSLDEVPLYNVPGAAKALYQRAVFCQAKGLLLAQFRTVERRDAAKNDAKEGRETADTFFASAHDALADLLRRGRVNVALL